MRVEQHVQHALRLAHAHEDKKHSHDHRAHAEDFAHHRGLAEGFPVMQVVRQNNHHSRSAQSNKKNKLGDIQTPHHIVIQPGDRQPNRLSQVGQAMPSKMRARRMPIHIQYFRLPTSAFSNMNIDQPSHDIKNVGLRA